VAEWLRMLTFDLKPNITPTWYDQRFQFIISLLKVFTKYYSSSFILKSYIYSHLELFSNHMHQHGHWKLQKKGGGVVCSNLISPYCSRNVLWDVIYDQQSIPGSLKFFFLFINEFHVYKKTSQLNLYVGQHTRQLIYWYRLGLGHMSVTLLDVDLKRRETAIDLGNGHRFENLKKDIDLRYRCLWHRNWTWIWGLDIY
jgi:hypothetical protein